MRKISSFFLFLLIGIIVSVNSSIGKEKKAYWPIIQPIKTTFHFVDHKNMSSKFTIMNTNGKAIYFMECYLNAYEHEDPDFDYSGDFECRLVSLENKFKYPTLLTEEKHPTRDWQSRGRFFYEDLMGKCAEYPEYGKIRHFRLRGMEITLEIKGFKVEVGSKAKNAPWDTDRINELELEFIVNPNSAITSEIAEPTQYLEPPRLHPGDDNDFTRNCEKVLIIPKKK